MRKIERLIRKTPLPSEPISRGNLREIPDPKLIYCLLRCDQIITTVLRLIKSFTFSGSTIFHYREMLTSFHEKISIGNEKKFRIYLSYLYDVLKKLNRERSLESKNPQYLKQKMYQK